MAAKLAPFGLRMPDALRDRIRDAAGRNRRSMNSEIVFHLERALPAQDAAGDEAVESASPAAQENSAALARDTFTNG